MASAQPLASAELLTVVILLSRGRARCALRACCKAAQNAGEKFIDRYQEEALLPLLYQRLMFWAPWAKYRTIRLEGSLMPLKYHEAMEVLAPGVDHGNRRRNGRSFKVFGCSSPTGMYKVSVEGTWMTKL